MVQSGVLRSGQRHVLDVRKTQSSTTPSNFLSATGTNNANYGNSTDLTNYLTPVGAFAASPGPYGTYDMGGDLFSGTRRSYRARVVGARGGCWEFNQDYMSSSYRNDFGPAYSNLGIGFRVASVPEPSTIAISLAGAACLLAYTRRRR